MKCNHCQAENPPGSRFCMNCGTALEIACPNCGTRLPAGAKFCSNCGASLAPEAAEGKNAEAGEHVTAGERAASVPPPPADYARKLEAARAGSSMEGERRVVTMLFCDVTGSTAIAEGMDPEEWTGIMNRAFELLMAPVYRYEGTVARLMGDAILAFFGAPIAHEDDPQRAVLAGLEILDGVQPFRQQLLQQYGIDFNVRVGINTGLVVVGRVGSDLKMEYTAMGDAVNVAARMEQTAAPGTLRIAEETHRLVSALFDFEPLGGLEVKGKKEPVQAYQVTGRRAGAATMRGLEGLRSPLVGREVEFERLSALLRDLPRSPGQIVSVIGEAGLGKSRLVAELRSWARREDLFSGPEGQPGLGWYEGRSFSYQTHTPYAPFIDLFLSQFGFSGAGRRSELSYTEIKDRVAKLHDQPAEVAALLASLFGVTVTGPDADLVQYLSPPQLHERMLLGVEEWLRRLAGQQPLVLVFEDLHWMDSASLELLERLLERLADLPVLVMALFRPNRQDAAWRYHELGETRFGQRYTAVFLQPLNEVQSRQLVANLLEIEDLPETIRALILRKAEGNPFFVEEVIRSLLDTGLVVRDGQRWRATREIANIAIPDTLAGVITARLDRLNEPARHLTQEAAVIGREFSYPVLVEVHEGPPEADPSVDAALLDLQQRELVREKTRVPQRSYSFKHILTQETAYQSLLFSRRRALHLRAAKSLERQEPDEVARIAHHYLEAQQPLRALPYLVQAGNQAAYMYATAEAVAFYQQALEIIPADNGTVVAREAYERLGRVLSLSNRIPEAVENYQAMHAMAQERGDIPMQVSALNKLSDIVAMRLGEFPKAEALLADAEQLARRYDDKPGLAEMFIIRCGFCTAKGDFHGAINYLDESVQIAEALEQKVYVGLGLAHIANTQVWMTEFDRAWQTAQKSLRIAQEIGNRELEAEVLAQAITLYHLHNADYRAAFASASEGVQIAERIGASMPESMGAALAGRMAMEMGDYEQALAFDKHSMRAGEAYGMPFLLVLGLCSLGSTYLEISETYREQTIAAHTRAAALLEQPGGAFSGGLAWLDLGFCALALGDEQSAAEYFQKGLTVQNPQFLITRPLHLAGMAAVALGRGDQPAAHQHLDLAFQFAEEKELRNVLPALHLARGQAYHGQGQYLQALASFDQAARLAAQAGLRPILWQAHAGAARALRLLGREEKARQRAAQAGVMIDEIAGLFQTESLRQAFLQQAGQKLDQI